MSQHPEERSKKSTGKSKPNDSEASKGGKGNTGESDKKSSKATSGRK